MSTLRGLILGLVGVLAALPAVAGNLAFLDAERAVVTVQEGKSQLKTLEGWARPRQASLERLQARVQELSDRYNQQRIALSAEALGQLERELVQAQRELEDETRIFNREVTLRREKILGEIAAKIGTLAGEYAETKGIDAVFLLGAQPIAYYAASLDITDAIIALYDERYPVKDAAQ